jgi:Ca2+-binding EF-hand superfamily protein
MYRISWILVVAFGACLAVYGQDAPQAKKKPNPFLAKLAQFTPEQFLKRFDKNNDGYLTRNEVPPFLAKNFEKLDADGDGKLDRAEIERYQQALRRRLGSNQKNDARIDTAQVDRLVDKMLKRFDTNQDGKISKDEAGDRLAKAFPLLDKNKDGYLERTELRVLAMRMAAKQGGKNANAPAKKAASEPDFDALDANADGRLTRDELQNTPWLRDFDRIDANRDGRIDPQEFAAYLKSRK